MSRRLPNPNSPEEVRQALQKINADTDGVTVTAVAHWNYAYTQIVALDALSGLLKCDGSGTYSAITDSHANWDAAYTHKTTEDAISGLVFCNGAGTYSAKIIGSDVQAWDADLDAIAALTGDTGYLKKTAENTWEIDSPDEMVYPDAGIALSTGSAWDTSIANNSANWNTAYGWGDHSSAGYFVKASDTLDDITTGSTNVHLTSTLKTGYDAAYTHQTTEDAISGIVKCDGAGNYSAVTDNSSNWDTAYGWGDHGSEGYLVSSDITNINTVYSATLDNDTVAGKVVFLQATGHVDLAHNDSDTECKAFGLCLTTESSGDPVDVVSDGLITVADWTDVAGAASLTPGTTYYLSTSVGSPGTPDYGNDGGTGDRTGSITATASMSMWIDGVTTLVNGSYSNSTWWNSISAAGEYVRFDFGASAEKVITEAKWYQSAANTHGTWKWQGSDNATDWTDIGTSFTLGGSTEQTQTSMSANVTGYRYYQLLGVSGTMSSSPYLQEIEFKIADMEYDYGIITSVVPSTSGSHIVAIGQAVTSTTLDIEIKHIAKLR